MKTKLAIIVLILFRLWLTTFTKHGDLHNGWNWAGVVARRGVVGFFDLPRDVFWPQSRPNQPAGSIYLYALSYYLNSYVDESAKFLNLRLRLFPSPVVWWWERYGDVVSLKLPSVIGDLAIYLAIVRFAKKQGKLNLGKKIGLVYLLTPPLWYNSSLWGQNDNIVAALAIWSLLLLWEKRLVLSTVLLGTSLATKASWAPLGLLYGIFFWRQYPKEILKILAVPATVLAMFWPFHPRLDLPVWLGKLYLERILPGESPYVSVNAFNLWQLIYGPTQIPDTVGGAKVVGIVIVIGLAIWSGRKVWLNPKPYTLIHSMLILYFGFFLFATRMHERYMYPLFPLLSLLIISGHKLWKPYVVLAATFLVNQYSQWWAPHIPALVAIYSANFTRIVSAVNLLVFGWIVKKHAD